MLTSTFPVSLLNSASIPALGCERLQPPAESSEADAVTRAQAGSHDAFSELYAQHKRRVFAICMRMVRDPSLAEDLTQESFLQMHRKLGSFRGDSVFTTWLHRLAVNTVLMHLRKRVLSVVSLDQLMANFPEQRAGRGFGTRDLTQAGAVDRLAIDRAVATLAPGYRSIFLLHDVQGFDHNENCLHAQMYLREHEVPTAQGAADTAWRPYCKSRLGRRRIGRPGKRFVPAADPDRPAKQTDEVTWHTGFESLVDGNRAGHVAGAIEICGHHDVISKVEIPACREVGGIKGDLIACFVSWINQSQYSGVHVKHREIPIEHKYRSWRGQNRDLAGNASTLTVRFKFDRDESASDKIRRSRVRRRKCGLSHASDRCIDRHE